MNRNAGTVYGVSLPIIGFPLSAFSYYMRFYNMMLEQFCTFYDSWQIQAMCLYQILCEAWQNSYQDLWNALTSFWWIFFHLNTFFILLFIFFSGISTPVESWFKMIHIKCNTITSKMEEHFKKKFELIHVDSCQTIHIIYWHIGVYFLG